MINIEDVGIFNALNTVQRGGKIDMYSIELVIWYLKAVKEEKAAEWVDKNQNLYLQGVMIGFKNEAIEIRNITNKEDLRSYL